MRIRYVYWKFKAFELWNTSKQVNHSGAATKVKSKFFQFNPFSWSPKLTPEKKVAQTVLYDTLIFNITHIGESVWAGESDRTPFIDRTEYYNLSC